MVKKFYIKERNNPQFNKQYYVAEGQLTIAEAKKKENPIYGNNYMLSFETEKEYLNAIDKFKADGFRVN